MSVMECGGKYVRYTPEQVEALERVYYECPKPSSLRRQQLIRESPILSNIEPKQIKVWFQNRRCREKQRKEATRLQALNRKLTALNKLLMEENDRLQKQVSQLVYENGYYRQQTQNAALTTTDTSCDSVVTSSQQHVITPQNPTRDATNPAGLLSIAEETLTEFLSKATGTAVEWVQLPGMKPGPDSIGIVAISHGCGGVAARACGLVGLGPTKVAEILKDKPSWLRDCRSIDVINAVPAGNNGTIEILYMQFYAPTTLAPGRDFWLLRYTSVLEDGSLVVCERSLNGNKGEPSMPQVQPFVRAGIFASGYLIRPSEGGGSVLHIVDHMDLEPWNVPEVLRPLYESSSLIAKKMSMAALSHLRQIAHDDTNDTVTGWGRRPTALRTLSRKLSRGFNEAVNGFADEGWVPLPSDGTDDISILVNLSPSKIMGLNLGYSNGYSPLICNSILCVKASMLLQNVSPATLLQFLREHRSQWADSNNIDPFSFGSIKPNSCNLPVSPFGFSSHVVLPLAHTLDGEEFLDVLKLENGAQFHDTLTPREAFLLQLSSGVNENGLGATSELIFAPINSSFTDESPLLPSGFRIIPLDPVMDGSSPNRTLDLASTLEIGQSGMRATGNCNSGNCKNMRSLMTIAFQFAFENQMQESVATVAREYIRGVISSVQRIALALSSTLLASSYCGLGSPPGSTEAIALAHWICQSYRNHTGVELAKSTAESSESPLKVLWIHPDSVLCCSLKGIPVFNFANKAGLDMLETTCVSLQDIPIEKVFNDEQASNSLCTEFPRIIQQGFVCFQGGLCMSCMGRPVSYEKAFAWKVLNDESDAHCICFMFLNWSFV